MPKMIPEETKQRAIRLVLDHLDEYPNLTAACAAVSARLGFGAESLRCVLLVRLMWHSVSVGWRINGVTIHRKLLIQVVVLTGVKTVVA